MDSQIRISDLESVISEKIFIKIEKWNLYLGDAGLARNCLLYTSPSPRDGTSSRMPSSA